MTVCGPLLTKKFSHRCVVILGAVMVVMSIFAMPWADSLQAMIVLYGFLEGLGFCFSYVPSHVLSGLYYNKYRSLATSGTGLGTAIFPPLASYLIEEYTWKGSFIIIAGLNLHVITFDMLLLPPPPLPPSPSQDDDLEPGDLPPELESPMTKKQFLKKRLCIFCDFGFDVYFVSNILWNCGAAVYIAFGPDFFIMQGLDKMDSSFMLTLFGLGEFVGGIAGEILGNIEGFNRLNIYISVNLMGGVMVFLFPVTDGYAAYGTLSFFFGLCFGVILGLLIIVMTDLLGADRIGDGLGYLMIANGIGAFTGPPIAGIFKDTFGGYEQALYFAGVTLFAAGFITFLIPLQKRFCRDDPEGNEHTSGRRCAQYSMSKVESSSSMKKPTTEAVQTKNGTQGRYVAVGDTTGSPEHKVQDGTPVGLQESEESVDDKDVIQVVISEDVDGIDNAAVKFE
ncbi:monocarboxylate transporter 13-like [Littorina saxatilis]|uniref:monocarboxylate transporter 13-like n=1 Tax=Littorina saxatilis TaxID=31220 RepID=UPI0038B64237